MEQLPDGSILLNVDDLDGVRSLIFAKKRACVDIHAPTEQSIRDFVIMWEFITGDDFISGKVAGFS